MGAAERVREIVEPILVGTTASLYDVEYESGILRVMLDREGGIDVDTIGDLASQISTALDVDDPFPGQRYLLEVTSPGIERKLRLPEHFAQQVDAEINVKLKTAINGVRRFEGRLIEVGDNGISVVDESGEEPVTHVVAFDDIEAARSVFRWPGAVLEDETKSGGRPRPQTPSTKTKSTNKKASMR